jgi:hypothetical protein
MEFTTHLFAIMQILIENHWKVRKCKQLILLANFHYPDEIWTTNFLLVKLTAQWYQTDKKLFDEQNRQKFQSQLTFSPTKICRFWQHCSLPKCITKFYRTFQKLSRNLDSKWWNLEMRIIYNCSHRPFAMSNLGNLTGIWDIHQNSCNYEPYRLVIVSCILCHFKNSHREIGWKSDVLLTFNWFLVLVDQFWWYIAFWKSH